jgi:hypothetical protein
MTIDVSITMGHSGTAVRLAGVNPFYALRVLQRCERSEITVQDAAQLLITAAQKGEATIEFVSARRWIPESLA